MSDYSPETEALVERDKLYHVHPYQYFDTFSEEGALPIESGVGATITDSYGKQYVDAVGGLWCTNIGLGREDMAEAIADQVRKLAYSNPFVDMTHAPAADLATKLAELAPGDLNHVFYSTGGSMANDVAYRLAQYYQSVRGKPEKRHVISRIDAYHGHTVAAVSMGGKPGDKIDEFEFLDNVHHLSSPNQYRYAPELTEQEFADQLVAEFEDKVAELGGPEKVSAFIAEPIMGSGGVVPPPGNYLKRIWEFCRANDILYISDEVVTGFGRLGEWFVSEKLFGIQPDIITSAKGLTSGYLPLAATIFSDRIFDVIAEPGHGRYMALGFTYGGHPVSCVAALKSIEILENENLLEHVRDIGPYFMEQLNTLRDLPMVGDVRGSHLMVCIEFVRNTETREAYPDELGIGKLVSNECDARGLMVRPVENLNIMSPPLVLTRDDIKFVVDTLREAIPIAYEKAEKLMAEE
ncbi:MAG: aminotransferase [bacterium]|nr:aminotransferase [bacterium]